MTLLLRPKTEIRQELLNSLSEKLGVDVSEQGNIAVAIVDTVLTEIYGLYQELELLKKEAYLSTSTGVYTELISQLVGTIRATGETDSELKLRASNSVYLNAKGNRLAIEEAVLAVPGVASLDYRPYGSGTGSFVVYVYPQSGVNQVRLLDQVTAAIETVVSEGIYFEVRQPTEVPVDLELVLQFDQALSVTEKQTVRNTVKTNLQRRLNQLKKDEVLYINDIIRLALSANSHVLDVSIASLKVNGIAKTITNTFPANDERFISGMVTVV